MEKGIGKHFIGEGKGKWTIKERGWGEGN